MTEFDTIFNDILSKNNLVREGWFGDKVKNIMGKKEPHKIKPADYVKKAISELKKALQTSEFKAMKRYIGGFEGKNGGEFDAEFYQEHLKSFSEEKRARLEIGWIQEDFFRTKLHTEDHLDTKWAKYVEKVLDDPTYTITASEEITITNKNY